MNEFKSYSNIRGYRQIYPSPLKISPLDFREAENFFQFSFIKIHFFSVGNLKNAKNISPCFLENCSEGGGGGKSDDNP